MPVFTVKVSTVPVEIAPDSLNITEVLKQRATASFTIPDPDQVLGFQNGEPVEILDGSLNVIFGGTIDQVESWVRSGTTAKFWSIRCNDWNQIAERRSSFTLDFENENLGDIVTTLVAAGLTGESITVSVVTGPVIASFKARYEYVSELLNRLAKLAAETTGLSWQWSIGYDRVLRFFAPGAYSAPFTVTADKCKADTIRVRETREDYFNRVVVRLLVAGDVTTYVAENTAEQAARALIEGGSGVYEKIITISGTVTPSEAQALADSELAGRTSEPISRVITFDTEEEGLQVGQMVTVDVDGYGTVSSPTYSVDYLIRRVSTRDEDGLVIWRSIEAIKGPITKDYVEYFQGLRGATASGASSAVTLQKDDLSAPTTAISGPAVVEDAQLIKIITQDGTGGRQITWSSDFDTATTVEISTGANKRSIFQFVGSGGKWVPIAAPFLEA